MDVTTLPANREHVERLLSFARAVLAVCGDLGITPVLTASLAVFAYTRDAAMEVHDIDLSCSESEFPRLRQSLEGRDIDCRVTSWHVLQARRGDLKVEFDATEYWMVGISEPYEIAQIAGVQFHMVSVDDLRALYRRGLVETADKADEANQTKHRRIRDRLNALQGIQQP